MQAGGSWQLMSSLEQLLGVPDGNQQSRIHDKFETGHLSKLQSSMTDALLRMEGGCLYNAGTLEDSNGT